MLHKVHSVISDFSNLHMIPISENRRFLVSITDYQKKLAIFELYSEFFRLSQWLSGTMVLSLRRTNQYSVILKRTSNVGKLMQLRVNCRVNTITVDNVVIKLPNVMHNWWQTRCYCTTCQQQQQPTEHHITLCLMKVNYDTTRICHHYHHSASTHIGMDAILMHSKITHPSSQHNAVVSC